MSVFRRFFPPKYSIGIDFGTTTSRLSYACNERRVFVPPKVRPIRTLITPVPNMDQSDRFTWYVGEDVLHTFWAHYAGFKLDMGEMQELELKPSRKPDEIIKFRPEILAARLIRTLWRNACEENSELQKFRDVTITVPAEWNAIQRQATLLAGQIAGFRNIQLIEEPVAAFLAINEFYPDDRLRHAKYSLVFDFGGGTLDVTIIYRPKPGQAPYVIGRSMIKGEIAGENIDEALTKMIISDNTWNCLSNRDRGTVKNVIRQMKEMLNPEKPENKPLSKLSWGDLYLPDSGITFPSGSLSLSQRDMNSLLKTVGETAIKNVRKAIGNSVHIEGKRISHKDIDAVLMVGGSSYLRVIQEAILKEFEGKIFGDGIYLVEPEEAVAIGAALYQSFLDRSEKRFRIRLSMDTYLEYNDGVKTNTLILGKPENFLPIKPKIPPVCNIPKNIPSINWLVKQEHVYSGSVDEVERVIFKDYDGSGDHLRIEYRINSNGIIDIWKPSLIYKQNRKPICGSSRLYDWKDMDPILLGKKYRVDSEN